MTKPYRVERDRHVADEAALDQAWQAIWPHVVAVADSATLIAGGRSAGSQVACRTAAGLGADAVLVLAYPLLAPGNPSELLAVTLPTLIVQGGQDPFGRPDQFPALPPTMQLVEIPATNHMFAPSTGGARSSLDAVASAVTAWISEVADRLQHG
jgi:predicted alpha/beta-hydrolase family hydrolase